MPEQANKNELKKKINLFLGSYFRTITIILSLFILVVGFVFILFPRIKVVQQRISENKQNQQDILNDKKVYISKLNNFINSYNKISDQEKTVIKNLLPSSINSLDLIEKMERLIEGKGFSLDSIDVPDKEAVSPADLENGTEEARIVEDEIKSVNLTLDVSGIDNYSEFKQLLGIIENSIPILDIVNFDYSGDTESVTFELKTYYFNSNG